MQYCINALLKNNNEIMQYYIINNDIALIMHYHALLQMPDQHASVLNCMSVIIIPILLYFCAFYPPWKLPRPEILPEFQFGFVTLTRPDILPAHCNLTRTITNYASKISGHTD